MRDPIRYAIVDDAMGYAVVDTGTTGIDTRYRHRIAEIAVIHLDLAGTVTDEWSTLINPARDLGPQAMHGIRAADVRRAPRFEQLAGDLIDRLRGRVVVAHNWPFDAMHLRAEFERIGVPTPFQADAGLCTMRAASAAMPGVRRSLIDCCAAAGLSGMRWHTARDDALAAARLLGHLITRQPVHVTAAQREAARWSWPMLPGDLVAPVHRTPAGHVEPHFLARLVERLPRDEEPVVDAYFAMLDDALLDRHISATESDALVVLAQQFGLGEADVLNVHHSYLREVARAACAEGVLTDEQRGDVASVARLLSLDPDAAGRVLEQERIARKPVPAGESARTVAVGGRSRAGRAGRSRRRLPHRP